MKPGAHVSDSDPRDRGPRETAPSTDLYLELLKRALLGLLSLRTVEPALRGTGSGRAEMDASEAGAKTQDAGISRSYGEHPAGHRSPTRGTRLAT